MDRSASSTRHLDRSLLHGLAWTTLAKWTTQLVRWVATFAIARILTPTDYGLVGMAMVYVGFVQLFSEFGLSSAIIQDRSLTQTQIDRLGGFSVLIGLGLFALSLALATPIARFFGEPAIKWIVIVLSAKFVIDSLAVVPRAMLARNLRFNRLAWVEGSEAFTLAVVTLAMAAVLRSYWALVAGLIASAVVAAIYSIASHPWFPSLPRGRETIRGSVRFGRDVVISTLAWYGYSNADFVVVGRFLDKAALGAYTLAWNIASVPVEKVSVMVLRVAPAIFSAVQKDTAAMRRYFLALTEGLAVVTFPMSIGLAIVADDFVNAALGARWHAAILPLRLLALYGGFRSIESLPSVVLVATAHTRQARDYSLASLIALPPAFVIGSRWGTAGVAAAWLVAYPLCTIPLKYRYTFKLLDLRLGDFFRALRAPLAGTIAMVIAVLAVRFILPASLPALVRLALLGAVGAATYGGYVRLFHLERLKTYRDVLRNARQGTAPVAGEVAQAQAT